MTYPDITNYGLRIPYDLDGAVAMSRSITDAGYEYTLTAANLQTINNRDTGYVQLSFGNYAAGIVQNWGIHYGELRFLFPEPMNIVAFSMRELNGFYYRSQSIIEGQPANGNGWLLQGSPDARSGTDGTWYLPTYPNGDVILNVTNAQYTSADDWRTYIWKVEWGFGPQTAVRFLANNADNISNYRRFYSIHFYGLRADVSSGEDLEFVESDKTQETSVIDYGNVAYPSTYERSYFIMNTSISKAARNIKLFPLKEDNTRPLDVDLSLTTGTYPQPILDADVVDNSTWNSSSPPASTQGTAQEVTGISISINTINSVKPVYVTFTGSLTEDVVGTSSTVQVDVYKNDIILMASSILSHSNPITHDFSFVDYLETPGIYTYIYKVWSPVWNGSYITSSTRDMALDVESHALLLGNLGPREAKQVFVRLSPGAGTVPVAYRIEALSVDGWTPEGFALAQTQAQVV